MRTKYFEVDPLQTIVARKIGRRKAIVSEFVFPPHISKSMSFQRN